jgi:hypothetical protein
VKDLPDIALLGTLQPIEAVRLRTALERTYGFRATHSLPTSVPDPPASWSNPYREMARENDLAWTTLDELTAAVAGFLNPILVGKDGVWHPAEWLWM